jgi:Trypsin-co-occurring domain 2
MRKPHSQMKVSALLSMIVFAVVVLVIAGNVCWGLYEVIASKFHRNTELTTLVEKVRADLATIEKDNPEWKVKDVELEINFSLKHSTKVGTPEKVEVASGEVGTERESGQRLLLKLGSKSEMQVDSCGCGCEKPRQTTEAHKP